MKERISRRDALHVFGALITTGIGVRIGLDRWLAPLDLDQRRYTFSRLQEEAHTVKGKKTLRSWLLFQGAQAYAASRGDEITAEAQQRYLFGDGSAWNITPHLTRHLLSRHGPYNGAVRDSDQALTMFYQSGIQQSFDNARRIDDSFRTNMEPATFRRAIKHGKPFTLTSEGIADGGGFSRDVLSTLGKFTVYNQGIISHVRPVSTQVTQGWQLDQRGGTAHLYDYHDWNHTEPTLLGGRVSAEELLDTVLLPLGVPNPRDVARTIFGNALDTAKIEIRGEDAIRLEKHGLAKPFPVYTDPHELRAVNSWYVPDYFFSKEPTFAP